MRISVAMCTYNGEKYIKEQLNSILAQTRAIDEIVVCDDGSSDSTVSILNEVLSCSNIEYKIVRNEKNLGFIKNFEKSISLCSGDVIFFSDQDDVWNPLKVEKMAQAFENNPDCVLCYSDAVVMNSDLSEVIAASLNQRCQITVQNILHDSFDGRIPYGCTEAVRSLFIRNIMPFCFAHDQWAAMCASCFGDVAYIDEPLIKYRRHSDAVTGYIPNGFLQHKISRVKQFCSKIEGGYTKEHYFEWPTAYMDSYSRYIELVGSVLKEKDPRAYENLRAKMAWTETLKEVCHTTSLRGVAILIKSYPQDYKRGNINTLLEDIVFLILAGLSSLTKK